MLSLESQLALNDLLRPFKVYFGSEPLTSTGLAAVSNYKPSTSTSSSDAELLLPCDVEIVDMSMLPNYKEEDLTYFPSSRIGITVRRLGFDGRYFNKGVHLSSKSCESGESQLGRVSTLKLKIN